MQPYSALPGNSRKFSFCLIISIINLSLKLIFRVASTLLVQGFKQNITRQKRQVLEIKLTKNNMAKWTI
jgi:hypothetical protein